MEGKKNIYETITAVMGDVGAVGKTSRNQQQNFMFRGIDAVMNALNPAMIKHHLFVVPEILEQQREERQTNRGGTLIYSICKIRYTFFAEDGSSVQAVVIGEGMDSGDKATNKAMSIAFKYACFQVFCIPTEEMQDADPDRECHDVAAKGREQSAPAQRPQRGVGQGAAGQGAEKERTQNAPAPQRAASQGTEKGAASRSKKQEPLANAKELEKLNKERERTGVTLSSILEYYDVSRPEEMTYKQIGDAIAKLAVKPNKQPKKQQVWQQGTLETLDGFEPAPQDAFPWQ